MKLLALDVGSSSVKVALFDGKVLDSRIARAGYATHYDGVRAEIDPDLLLAALAEAIGQTGDAARQVDAIALSVLSPAWIAMDQAGLPLTPLITHQDRRSVGVAQQIEERIGTERHLSLAGNRPFPGGISSTTCAWFAAKHPDVLAKADLLGHLNTFLHRQLTGARVIDPSNASFSGLYSTLDQGGWSAELCETAGVLMSQLPRVLEANAMAGTITAEAAAQFGLRQGTPMMTGAVDTSAAMYLTGAVPGQLFHMCGSTDVLGMATDDPVPNMRLLTRALGIGKRWMSVSTLAAAGSAIEWIRCQCFADHNDAQFYALLAEAAQDRSELCVQFAPYLAGERTSIEQKQGAFTGLTLSTTRQDMLRAVVEALAEASAARVPLLQQGRTQMLKTVYVSGGGAGLSEWMHRNWTGDWEFESITEAGLHGLALMVDQQAFI